MGFDYSTWGKSWKGLWLNSWGKLQDDEEKTAVPTLRLRKDRTNEDELLLLLYASKYEFI